MPAPSDRDQEAQALEARELTGAARAWLALAAGLPPDERAPALARASRLLLEAGRTDKGLARLEEARILGGPGQADVLAASALALRVTGRVADAVAVAEAAREARGEGPRADEARLDLAAACLDADRVADAAALLEGPVLRPLAHRAAALRALLGLAQGRAMAVVLPLKTAVAAARAAGHRVGEAELTGLLGRALLDLRDYGRARPVLEAAVRLAGATGQARVAAAALGGAGLCRVGAPDTAASLAEGSTLLRRAVFACAEADDPAAEDAWRTHLDEALAALGRHDERAKELVRWAQVAQRLGDGERAARLHEDRGLACALSSNRPGELAAWVDAEAAWRAIGRTGRADAARQRVAELTEKAPLPPRAPR